MKIFGLWKKRKWGSHKGQNGKVLVVGGSERYAGAPAMAGIAALRAGADLVYVAAPEKVAWAVNCLYPDLITVKLKGRFFQLRHVKECLKLAEKADAVLVGNGMGSSSKNFLKKFLPQVKKPLILDADAITAGVKVEGALLTPHRKEFERYYGKKLTPNLKENVKIVMQAAGKNVILLKGATDIIADAHHFRFDYKGNPGMTKGGTGDTIAGFCAGLMAQGMNAFDAACEAAFIIGFSGQKKSKVAGYSYLASELAEDIKKIKKKLV